MVLQKPRASAPGTSGCLGKPQHTRDHRQLRPVRGYDRSCGVQFFRCFIDPRLFDRDLDFAVREWARRDDAVRLRIDAADRGRLGVVSSMFERHGYSPREAEVRARILYFMQLGYHALDVREPTSERMARLKGYLLGFIGEEADSDALAQLRVCARRITDSR